MTTESTEGTIEEPEKKHRPTLWIVLTCVLAVVAVGLGIWAFNAQSEADDAQTEVAELEAQRNELAAEANELEEQAAEDAEAQAAADAEAQQRYEDVSAELGETSDDVAQVEQDLAEAEAKLDDAEQAQDELETAKAETEKARTCLRGTLSALGDAFSDGGLQAAVAKLETLAGECRSEAS